MVELTPQERLQPSLLDRLTDDAPEETKESADKRVLSLNQLRASVLRDLGWLFNSTRLMDPETAPYPEVAHSVVNFGLPGLAGYTASNLDITELERMLTETIADFEPRILRHTLVVRAHTAEDEMSHNAVSFEIEGDLWADPVPMRLLMRTEIDLESGHVRVTTGDRRR